MHSNTSKLPPPPLTNICTAILIHIHMHQLTQQNCHPLCTTRSYWHFSTSKLPPSLANTYAATLIHKKHVSSNAANIVTPSGHHVHTCISALQNCHLLWQTRTQSHWSTSALINQHFPRFPTHLDNHSYLHFSTSKLPPLLANTLPTSPANTCTFRLTRKNMYPLTGPNCFGNRHRQPAPETGNRQTGTGN